MTKALRHDGIILSVDSGGRSCPTGKTRKRKEIADQLPVSLRRCPHLSIGCSISRAWPPIRAADATARDRFVLGCSSTSR